MDLTPNSTPNSTSQTPQGVSTNVNNRVDNKLDRWVDRLGTIYAVGRGPVFFAIGILMVHQFVATVTRVNGASMSPTLRSGQYVVVDRASLYVTDLFRGDIVILRFPGDPEQVRYVKRVVGLPGEEVQIKDNKLSINGQPMDEWYLPSSYKMQTQDNRWVLGADQYFLLGDNRQASSDSRVFGPVERRFVVGRVY